MLIHMYAFYFFGKLISKKKQNKKNQYFTLLFKGNPQLSQIDTQLIKLGGFK